MNLPTNTETLLQLAYVYVQREGLAGLDRLKREVAEKEAADLLELNAKRPQIDIIVRGKPSVGKTMMRVLLKNLLRGEHFTPELISNGEGTYNPEDLHRFVVHLRSTKPIINIIEERIPE